MLFFPEQQLAPHVICFTTSVFGGISDGDFRSFNLGAHVGDNLKRVEINRALLQALIKSQIDSNGFPVPNLAPIIWLNQQHSTSVVNYQNIKQIDDKQTPIADAIFTDLCDVPLSVMTADCMPIAIYCSLSERIAVIHAGYKGLMQKIIANTLSCFEQKHHLRVWIGPCIKQHNFQISEALLPLFKAYKQYVKTDNFEGKFLVDLPKIAIHMLHDEGVTNVQSSDVCTYDSTACFSHRRNSHQKRTSTGRMATIIIKLNKP